MPLLFKQLIQAASFLHYVGIAHSNINPDNVCAEDVQHQVPRGSTFGYDSPESIVYPAVNLLKRDAWAIGMTLYTGFTGIPFYGFTLEKQKVVALSRNDYSKVLIDAYYFGRGQEEPIKLDVDSQLSFRSFGPQAIRLLISDPAYRPTPLAMLNMLTRSANQASSKTDTYLAETAFKS
ncbi:hypothetical protein BDF19DRAFT_437278 [Syncephalis fuscata]|nr:hypothetical protein BDF19DRAFT_437278 [Syncephalis fuscata]